MSTPLRGKVVAMTGTLSIPRDQFAILIEDAGGIGVTSLSKSTDILIVGADPGEAKLDKARENGTTIWDEAKARAVMAGEDKGLYTQKVYGASDDLVELAGCVREELVGGDEPTYIRFTNGTYVKVVYGPEGVWRIEELTKGNAKTRLRFGMPDGEEDMTGGKHPQAHGDSDAPVYSDVLVISSEEPIELAAWGRKPLKEVSPDRAQAFAKARAIIAALDARGFDAWWHDIDQDDKAEVLEELAAIVEGKS